MNATKAGAPRVSDIAAPLAVGVTVEAAIMVAQ